LQCAEHKKVVGQKLKLNTHNRCVQSSNQSSNHSLCKSLPSELKDLLANVTALHHVVIMCAAPRQCINPNDAAAASELKDLLASVTALHHVVIMCAAPRQCINPNDAAAVKAAFNCSCKLQIMMMLLHEELVVGTFSAMGLVIQQMLGAHWHWSTCFDALTCKHRLGAPR
jgi:hypothetical protein